MSLLMRPLKRGRRAGGPSLREVCLLGLSRTESPWTPGDRLAWGGRSYQVESTEGRPDGNGRGDGPRYVHLRASGSPAGADRPGG